MSNNRTTYKFALKVGNETPVEINPLWGGDINRVFEKESEGNGGQFYRSKVTGKFTITGNDFDLVNDADFETEFEFLIEELNGTQVFKGFFSKTDCTFDLDDCFLEVSPERRDEYENVITGAEKEFNFLELDTQIEEVRYKKKALLQIYNLGSSFITNYLGGNYFEERVVPENNAVIVQEDYKFTAGAHLVFCTGVGQSLNPDVSGKYDASTSTSENGFFFIDDIQTANDFQLVIRRTSDNAIVYEAPVNQGLYSDSFFGNDSAAVFQSVSDANSKCQFFQVNARTRILTDKETIGGQNTEEIPEIDLGTNSYGYNRCLQYSIDTIALSDAFQLNKGRHGKLVESAVNGGGEYFETLIDNALGETYPLGRSDWQIGSKWFYYNQELRDIQEEGSENFTLRNAYRLSSVISALLAEIAPNVTHEEDLSYSRFLYGATNPISNELQPELFITPATNIKVNEYDKAAERSNIRLGDIFKMLWTVYKVGWYIEDNKLKFEHISFFENGNSYTEQVISEDLTENLESKTGKNWGFRTSKFKFEKQNLPERIFSKWASEKASVPFYGFPIEVQSSYVQKGNIEEMTVPRFYTDIDFMLSNPNEVSDDDIVLIGATGNAQQGFEIPFLEFSTGLNRTYNMQNGYLSFVYLHEHFHRHSLPANNVLINENETTATTVVRSKIQEIEYPLDVDFDPDGLIKTELGNGKLKSATENLSSKTAKIVVIHDTE